MLVLEGEAGAVGGDTGYLRGVPHELRVVGLKRRFGAEVVCVRLGLDEPPGEADPQAALAERCHVDRQAGSQGTIDRRHRPVDKIAGRHGVGVPAEVGLKSLVHQAGVVHPPKGVKRRVDRRPGRLRRILGMCRWIGEGESVVQEVRRTARRLGADRKSREPRCCRLVEVPGEQRLGVTLAGAEAERPGARGAH